MFLRDESTVRHGVAKWRARTSRAKPVWSRFNTPLRRKIAVALDRARRAERFLDGEELDLFRGAMDDLHDLMLKRTIMETKDGG